MDLLPEELVALVFQSLTRNELKTTLTVSRRFQHASERASGAFTEYDLNENNTQDFLALYNGRRWGYLRHVRFKTQLAPYEEESDGERDEADGGGARKSNRCRESAEELRDRDEQFTRQIDLAFTTLQTAERRHSGGALQLTVLNAARRICACPHLKCTSWRLHLLRPGALPALHSIRALVLADDTAASPLTHPVSVPKLAPRVLPDLAAACPRLEHLGCRLGGAGTAWTPEAASAAARHFARDAAGPLRDARHGLLPTAATASVPSTLRHARLDFLSPPSDADRIDQCEPLPDLVAPAPRDPFSAGLHELMRGLTRLELRFVGDAALFGPDGGGGGAEALWPRLESLSVAIHPAHPDGRWYFEGPAGEGAAAVGRAVGGADYPPLQDGAGEAQWHRHVSGGGRVSAEDCVCRKMRVRPAEAVLGPFLAAFARAAAAGSMPRLREAQIWAPLLWDASDVSEEYEDYESTLVSECPGEPLGWGVTYLAPSADGHCYFPDAGGGKGARRLWWKTAGWRPGEELHELFRGVGDRDAELVEYWGHEDYGDKLAHRKVFEAFDIFDDRSPGRPWPVESLLDCVF